MPSGEVAGAAASVILALFISLTCVRYVYCRSIRIAFRFWCGPAFPLVLHKYAKETDDGSADRRQTAAKRFIVLYIGDGRTWRGRWGSNWFNWRRTQVFSDLIDPSIIGTHTPESETFLLFHFMNFLKRVRLFVPLFSIWGLIFRTRTWHNSGNHRRVQFLGCPVVCDKNRNG